MASITAISPGAPRRSWITLSASAPTTAPGIVPTTSAQAMRSSDVVIARAAIVWNHARR